MADLATAYIKLVPSLQGAQKTIEGELAGVVGSSGGKAGKALGDSVGGGLLSKMGGIASQAVKILAGAFAAKKVFDFGKAAFDAYADFEQLSGGVEKLFGDAYDTVQANADAAFANMGLSANDYMSQVTSFSAALINDLGGDTEAAAAAADKAMTSMADNASIFGSDVQSVQNAYQGFAKQNYTMLDNLKLGYGGTKEEMQRLIDDANEYGKSIGQAGDLSMDSFADIVDAIDLIQQKQGIAGNAAKESSKTLSGSIAATKAAWQNLVTEFGKPDADIGARIGDMFKALMGENGEGGMLRNVVTEVGVIARNLVMGVATGVQMGFQWLVTNGPQVVSDAMATISAQLPVVLAKVGEIADAVVQWLSTQAPALIGQAAQLLMTFAEWLTGNGPMIVDKVAQVFNMAWQWLVANGPTILQAIGQILSNVLAAIVEHGPQILTNIATTIGTIVGYIGSAATQMLTAAIEFMGGLITGTSEEGEKLRTWFSELPGRLLAALGDVGSFLLDAGAQIIQGFWDGLKSKWSEVTDWVSGIGSWIAEHKGPKTYDLGLLVPNGEWIMQGLSAGIEAGIPQLQQTLDGITGTMQASVSARYGAPAMPARQAAPAAGGWSEVASAIGGLRGDMGHMGIYLDGNTLVGGISARMDRALVV